MEEKMEVRGKIQKIMKSDEGTAFIIARVDPTKNEEISKHLSVYGNFSVMGNGYLMEECKYIFKGKWKKGNFPYGDTFLFDSYEKEIPDDLEGLEAYLRTIKGIGPTTAKRIVDKFQMQTLDIMENNIGALLEVKGITEKKLKVIREHFTRNKDFEELAKFTSKYGISGKKTVAIYEKWGKKALKKINENPYLLCDEIDRISFITSDFIARKMGFPLDHIYRLKAGITHILKNACYNSGHIFLYEQEVAKEFNKFFPNIDMIRFEEVLSVMEKQELIARIDEKDKIYLPRLLKMEDYVARKTVKLCGSGENIEKIKQYIEIIEKENNITYDEKQIEAIMSINSGSSFNIITGGPGTGKSTIIKAILGVLKKDNEDLKVKLAAPTGRAAKRMEEATGHPASTVHRLLESKGGEFLRNKDNPIEADVLIVDESSMLDMELFCNLINAVAENTRLFLVGDVDQLPPVGIGYVFRDLIESEIVPVVKLNKVFRQGEGSIIKVNAKNIREGIPKLTQEKHSFEMYCYKKQDDRADLQKCLAAATQLFKNCYAKQRQKVKTPIYQVQLLSPMRKGILGVNNLNYVIQKIYNPPSIDKKQFIFPTKDKLNPEYIYRVGDKVMQIANDYNRELEFDRYIINEDGENEKVTEEGVFNGDLGIITKIEDNMLYVKFENEGTAKYEKAEVRENLVLAYACTVHKSQGSEYNDVIIINSYTHAFMRQRNLFYTGVTRAKETVMVVGDLQSIAITIKTVNASVRNSKLKERLEIYKNRNAA